VGSFLQKIEKTFISGAFLLAAKKRKGKGNEAGIVKGGRFEQENRKKRGFDTSF